MDELPPPPANSGDLVLTNRKFLAIFTMICGAGFLVAGVALIGYSNEYLIGAALVAGVVCLGLGLTLMSGRPKVILTAAGVEDVRLQTGVIPWDQIVEVQFATVGLAETYIFLTLREPERFPVYAGGLNALMLAKVKDLADVAIYARPLNILPQELARIIVERAGIE